MKKKILAILALLLCANLTISSLPEKAIELSVCGSENTSVIADILEYPESGSRSCEPGGMDEGF